MPFDRFLVEEGYEVVGVDISEKHIRKAKENVPEAEFIQGDFFEPDFDEDSFEAIVSFYAIFHIPREEHEELFRQMSRWLKPDGMILVTIDGEELDEASEKWEGNELVWSSFAPEETVAVLERAGFEVIDMYEEDWREEDHVWVLAEKTN